VRDGEPQPRIPGVITSGPPIQQKVVHPEIVRTPPLGRLSLGETVAAGIPNRAPPNPQPHRKTTTAPGETITAAG